MLLPIGTRIGPYEITGTLGVGGMGEVYRARDARLARDVALKVLPQHFASDPERGARFQREAQVLAALNHPGIGAIYGLEDNALVLELVDGETLADHVARGPMGTDEALRIARQIADAVQAAHDQGIIHRDLKPANIKLQTDGSVKVLDFGLAKLTESNVPNAPNVPNALSMSPTITSPAATGLGVILGTAAYMAPEQAKGRPADKRGDVWAFGCVLFEMLTGKRAFDGEDVSDTLALVLKGEPSWGELPADTPPAVRALLHSCLEKDRRRRTGDMSAALFALDHHAGLSSHGANVAVVAPSATRGRRAAAAVAATVVVGVAAGYGGWMLKPSEVRQVARFNIALPEGHQFTNTGRHLLAISPAGGHIVYAANQRLYLRAIDQLDAVEIRGTEGSPPGTGDPSSVGLSARSPFFSADGQWIGFWKDNQLKKVAITGGAPVTICDAENPWGVSWAADNTILFGQGPSGISRVAAAGGKPENIVKVMPGESAHGPQLLPGGRAVLFTLASASNWDDGQIVAQSLETGERRVLVNGGTDARFLSTGHLAYVRRGTLLVVRFDPDSLTVNGGPVPVLEEIAQSSNSATGAAQFAVSDTGALVYIPTSALVAGTALRGLTWVDRAGREEPLKVPVRAYLYPRLSPDGTRLALDLRDQQNDIWIWDLARNTLTRLTFDPGLDRYPIWTPDGRRVVYSSQAFSANVGSSDLYWQLADGTGPAEPLTEVRSGQQYPTGMSPDAKYVIQEDLQTASANSSLFLVAAEGDHRRQVLLRTSFSERNGTVSPDGRWIAYEANTGGRFDIYVRPFPDVDSGQWQVSTTGGTRPLWARNGHEVFYVSPSGAIMSVAVEQGTTWKAGTPMQVVPPTYVTAPTGYTGRNYDVSPDGKRFLMLKNAEGSVQAVPVPRVVVVEHWFEELKQRVPVQ